MTNDDPRLSEATPEQLRTRIDAIEAEELAAAMSAAAQAEFEDVRRTGDELTAVCQYTKILMATERHDCPSCEAKAGTPCGDLPKDIHMVRLNLMTDDDGDEILKRARGRRPSLFAKADRYRKMVEEGRRG